LFRVQQRFEDARGRRVEVNFLVDGGAVLLGLTLGLNGTKTAEN
jgi:hypothetical protein